MNKNKIKDIQEKLKVKKIYQVVYNELLYNLVIR